MKLAQLSRLLGGVVLSSVMLAVASAAETFPSQAIRLIVPFSAGGGNDIVARLLAKRLDPALNVPIVVENRPGAGGNIGLRSVAQTAPDGYTLGYVSNGVVMNPYLYREVGFDVAKDFDPVAVIAATPIWVLVNPKVGVSSMAELLAKAKANPGGLSYATPGVGTPQHLGAELLQALSGVKLIHVPYKGASGAATDVVGGQVDVLISTPASVQAFVKSGQLQALATMDAKRAMVTPDLPAVAETVPGFEASIWHGLVLPDGANPAVVQRLSDSMREALASPEFQQELSNVGFTAQYESPEAMRERMNRELKMWGEVTRQAGIKPE